MSKVYITRGDGLRARKQPTTDAAIVGMFPAGAKLAVDHNATVGEDIWHALPVTAGGVGLRDPGDIGAPAFLWAAHRYRGTDYTEAEVIEPPVSARRPYRIGVHVIGDWRAADMALEAGAPVVFGMHGHLEMVHRARAWPDRIFIYRGWVPGGSRPTPRDVFGLLQVGPDDPPNIWYVGTNENDHFGDDPQALRGRVLWDKDLFYMLRDVKPDVRYFGLSLGHGCPGGIEDPNGPVVDALRGYIDLWNEGMGIDKHNYTKGKRYRDDPVSDSPIHDPMWYEKRGDFWFTNVGLDPRRGGGFIHGETGVEANQGGYRWAGYSGPQFARHIRTLSDIGRSPIVIPSGPNAGTWPSVDLAGAIYMYGDDQTWTPGYDTRGYTNELRAFWAEGR